MLSFLAMGVLGIFLAWLTRTFWDDGRIVAAGVTAIVLVCLAVGMFNHSVSVACSNDLFRMVAPRVCGEYHKPVW